ncbi:hypothetical protein E3O55_16050 [Cryobacterium sp. MDB1-18-2]|uniref:DUF7657 domain-containing protein n=1 Tax=unclassified Cryobacterium TaxID=2649013 RepID=UPI00106D2CE5|nr:MULTISPECIES: hypothetical protein [unclassified Cryobacterium]TFC09822.1 hypothetical protein E3O59_05090 [Cryobacterium sp. MDB2-33-2]TFC24207.1 hypothetical protein E3O55_16050 [Cryobacterium sp. MDB1-18-2]TFC43129.1 hypothetical protein E3O50_07640 [Cryobacterium sp. MDB1-18-1]
MPQDLTPVVGRSRLHAWRDGYRRFTEPGTDGLPRTRVLLAFPALLLILGIVLVALGINGSSSGVFHSQIAYGSDSSLIAGTPQLTRSDEWNVQTVWAIAQVQQGLPLVNETFPGGMDATLPQDLPRVDWTVAFRPHLWGFMVMDVDHAIAFKWWLPGLALAAAAYMFLVTLLPRRPGVSAMIAVGFLYSPLFQWWYLSTTLWPVVWALTAMTALIHAFSSSSLRSRWGWAALVGYLTVVMATGIYVPFIVPAVLVVLFFAVGLVIERRRENPGLRAVLSRVGPVLVAGVAASAVTVLWLATKLTTVEAFLGTTYPGNRVTPTGGGSLLSFASAIGSSFTQTLNAQRPGLLGANGSEASTFFYIGIYLLPVVGWIVFRQARAKRMLPWTLIGLTAVVLLLLAYLYVPGWDAIARLLLLDKTSQNRVRLGMGLASLGLLAYVLRYLDEHRVRAGFWIAAISAGLFALSQAAIGYVAIRHLPGMLEAVQLWWLWALLSAAAIYFAARRQPRLAATAFLIVTIAGSGLTNPIYSGVLDLRETAVSRAVVALDASAPKTWVGIGGGLTTAVLLESGVRAENGFQGAPSRAMWGVIDPANQYAFQWNRLAGVSWVAGPGEPVVSNPAEDQIRVTFDACSAFAQANVGYVLADDHRLDSTCLKPVQAFELPKATLEIYQVVPR